MACVIHTSLLLSIIKNLVIEVVKILREVLIFAHLYQWQA